MIAVLLQLNAHPCRGFNVHVPQLQQTTKLHVAC